MLPTHTPSPGAVAWNDVSKTYPNGHRALEGVSLTVAEGEILALLGTSGSGKTTLLKMVNALVQPSSGQVLVRGRPTAGWDPIALRRSIGYVIQEGGLMPHLSVLENVALAARVQGRPRARAAGPGDVQAGAGRVWSRHGSVPFSPGSSAAASASAWGLHVPWRPAASSS